MLLSVCCSSFLKEQFGKVPTIGWQLDPFGHSATHASLMCGLLGFDGLFFGRADYQVISQPDAQTCTKSMKQWATVSQYSICECS